MTEQAVAARIDRLPLSRWHFKIRMLFGGATFFDSFDAYSIAFALPLLLQDWHIKPAQIGNLLAIGYVGQMAGALVFGWLAERYGRRPTARIAILIFGLFTVACAAANNYEALFWLRLLQGIGLGGEVPIAAAYIAELAPSRRRGRFFLAYELLFVLGITASAIAGAWIVPRFGWRWFFALGGVPAIILAIWQRVCPESPRWLASRGRFSEADATLSAIENEVSRGGAIPLPAPEAIVLLQASPASRWQELFQGIYLRRTLVVWVLWASAYLLNNGFFTWLPTLFSTVYKLPIQQALTFSVLPTAVSLISCIICIFAIDSWGRRPLMTMSLILVSATLFLLAGIGGGQVMLVLWLTTAVRFFNGFVSFSLYLYTPELYPTRIRALGTSWASFWLRAGSMLGPLLIGYVLPLYGIDGVFVLFGVIAAAAIMGAVETRGKRLEEISP
jgi:putative MFS transporter